MWVISVLGRQRLVDLWSLENELMSLRLVRDGV